MTCDIETHLKPEIKATNEEHSHARSVSAWKPWRHICGASALPVSRDLAQKLSWAGSRLFSGCPFLVLRIWASHPQRGSELACDQLLSCDYWRREMSYSFWGRWLLIALVSSLHLGLLTFWIWSYCPQMCPQPSAVTSLFKLKVSIGGTLSVWVHAAHEAHHFLCGGGCFLLFKTGTVYSSDSRGLHQL